MFGLCSPRTASQILLNDADFLYKKQSYLLAIEKYKELLTLLDFENPETHHISENKVEKYLIPALYGLSLCHYELQQYYVANERVKQLLSFRPKHVKAKKLHGLISVHTGDYKAAMKTINTK